MEQHSWICKWEIDFGDSVKRESRHFRSFNEAKSFVRKLITTNCSDNQVVRRNFDFILSNDEYPKMRHAIFNFIFDYLTRDEFYPADYAFPSTEAIDYYERKPIKESVCNSSDDDEYDEEDFYREEEQAALDYSPEDYDAYIAYDAISFMSDGFSILNTNMVTVTDDTKLYEFELSAIERGGLESLKISLEPGGYDKAAYPLLILKTLQNSNMHLMQEEIRDILTEEYNFSAERKAIGRYLKLLKELDFGLCHDKRGYYIKNDADSFSAEEADIIKKAIEAYSASDDEQKEKILAKIKL